MLHHLSPFVDALDIMLYVKYFFCMHICYFHSQLRLSGAEEFLAGNNTLSLVQYLVTKQILYSQTEGISNNSTRQWQVES